MNRIILLHNISLTRDTQPSMATSLRRHPVKHKTLRWASMEKTWEGREMLRRLVTDNINEALSEMTTTTSIIIVTHPIIRGINQPSGEKDLVEMWLLHRLHQWLIQINIVGMDSVQ